MITTFKTLLILNYMITHSDSVTVFTSVATKTIARNFAYPTKVISTTFQYKKYIACKKSCSPTHLHVKVSRDLDYLNFFLKKLLWGPRKLKLRHLWLRWSWPNVLAYQNFWSTIWHPLVAKFSNTCHFWHFLRVRWKRSPQSTGLPWKI